MKSARLLCEKNTLLCNVKNIKLKKGKIIYSIRREEFDGICIKNLLGFVRYLNIKYKNIKMPIILDIGNVTFADKLTYIFLEIICYLLIRKYGHLVQVLFSCKPNIFIEGITSSPLLLLNSLEKNNMVKFMEKFQNDLFENHYRMVLSKSEDNAELSKRMDEFSYFLKFSGVDDSCIDELAEVFAELVGNVWEHTYSDCLVDVDVTNSYFKKKSEGSFVGINIAVLNFSEELLGDRLYDKITNSNIELPDRYELVRKAYKKHSMFFDDDYIQEDFFNIASFQHKISGRSDKSITGGTGLTKLISSLEKRSDAHNCYLISGNRALFFIHQYLEYDANGWIGFNLNNNFFEAKPAKETIGRNAIYMPGTAYNLNFVMKRGNEYGECDLFAI